MSRPRTTPIETRRKEILEAALAVLINKGYQDLRLDDVAKKAGVAKGTLYLYFKDKERLYFAVMNDILKRITEEMAAVETGSSALQTLRRIALLLLKFGYAQRDFFAQIVLQKPTLCGNAAARVIRQGFEQVLDQIARRIQACVKEGTLRPVPLQRGSMYLITLVRMFALFQVPLHPSRSMESHTDDLMDLFLNGLSSKRGQA